MQIQTIIIVAIVIVVVGFIGYIVWKNWHLEKAVEKWKQGGDKKMYELAILKELGERVGYSLDVQKIIDIITGSLHQFIEYSAVSYFILGQEKIIFKVHLEESVSRAFVDNVRDRMLGSLSALMDKEFKEDQLSETLSGSILTDEIKEPVRSFFNIPLVIGGRVVGILTVAHTKPGLYKEDEMTILYKITKQASDAVSRLEEVVKTEQRKLNAMVESMSEGVVMTDKDYRLLVVNPSARETIGLADKKEITIFDFIDNLDGKFDIRGKLEESVKLDKILTSEDVLIKDRFYKIIVSPVKSGSGLLDAKEQIFGGVTIFHDITHEKEVERLREDFMAIVVHELRSPLTGIKNLAEVIGKYSLKSKKQEDMKKKVDLILDSSSNMLVLVNDLLDAAKIESGKFEVLKKPSDIKKIIQRNADMFDATANNAKIKLLNTIDPKIPVSIEFDEERIAQSLGNLVSNSIKFTPEGGHIKVQALLHKSGNALKKEADDIGVEWFVSEEDYPNLGDKNFVIIAVTDNGVGISEEDRLQLFNKFKQLQNTTSNNKKGTGLGLSIVKGIINAHGGEVGVKSKPGIGSTFYFTIPINIDTIDNKEEKNYEQETQAEIKKSKKKKNMDVKRIKI